MGSVNIATKKKYTKKFFMVGIIYSFDIEKYSLITNKRRGDEQHSFLYMNTKIIYAHNEETAIKKYITRHDIDEEHLKEQIDKYDFFSKASLFYSSINIQLHSDNLPLNSGLCDFFISARTKDHEKKYHAYELTRPYNIKDLMENLDSEDFKEYMNDVPDNTSFYAAINAREVL